MANGLGFTTEPPAVKRVSKQTSIDMSSLPPVVETATGFLRYTGTLPTLLIFALAVAVPPPPTRQSQRSPGASRQRARTPGLASSPTLQPQSKLAGL